MKSLKMKNFKNLFLQVLVILGILILGAVPISGTGTPTRAPTRTPTRVPTAVPTRVPTGVPTRTPTAIPTAVPSFVPTYIPTLYPPTSHTFHLKQTGWVENEVFLY